MAQVGNNVNRVSGAHLIGDQNHMGEIIDQLQAEQSQSQSPRQDGDQNVSGQQGGERKRKVVKAVE